MQMLHCNTLADIFLSHPHAHKQVHFSQIPIRCKLFFGKVPRHTVTVTDTGTDGMDGNGPAPASIAGPAWLRAVHQPPVVAVECSNNTEIR
jgi:hypothetical protein